MEIRFRVPRVPAGLFANLLGVIGLIAVAVSVGGFLSSLNVPGAWWVAGFIAAIEAITLSWIASTHAEAEAQWAKEPTRPMELVKPKASKSA